MTLRMRLFLIVGGLIAVLVLAQWWWTRVLARELSAELDDVASKVGQTVAGFFVTEREHRVMHRESTSVDCPGDDCEGTIQRLWSWRDAREQEPSRPHAGIDEHVEGRHKAIKILSPDGGEDGPAHGYLEFDSETGNVKIEGDLRIFEDKVQVTDLGQGRYAFTFRHLGGEQPSGGTEIFESKIKIHLEHEGDERFLFVDDGGPHPQIRRVQIPSQGLRDKLESFSRKLMLASLGILAIGLALAGALAHRLSAPLRRLAEAARKVGAGALGTRVPEVAGAEVGQAISAFNTMSGRLAELEARTRELSARQHLGEIGEIARGLAHSLRNPLNALGLSVEELAARNSSGTAADRPSRTSETGAELAVAARRQIRRIDGSIRSFLALASEGSGSAAADVNVAELAADVVLEALQDGRGRVRVETDAEPGLTPLRAVAPELRAVIQALVVNAVEASPAESLVTVRLRSGDSAANGVQVEVEDRGAGLPPEIREKLFTPHLSTKASGSGMGLFLAHRIATNRYGGRLELHDRDGGGTRAVLELRDRIENPAEGAG